MFFYKVNFLAFFFFQATSQTDLENWVTAIHSASASLFAKKLGKEDTIRLLKNQTKSLIQKIDMDSKMKKMAELQLSIVSDPKNRKAIENQVINKGLILAKSITLQSTQFKHFEARKQPSLWIYIANGSITSACMMQ